MKVTCPTCKQVIPPERINIAKDVAHCEPCNELFSLSATIAGGGAVEGFDRHDPPRGAWCEETGFGWQIGSTTRSAAAFFLVPFMCVWSGFSLGGIYGMQIVNGEFNIWLSLFGIPFVIGTLALGSLAVMTVIGKVVVTVEGDSGTVFEGVGPIGWTRRFEWPSVTSIEEDYPMTRRSGQNNMAIALVGQSRLKFGSILSEPRRYTVLQCLRSFHAARGGTRHGQARECPIGQIKDVWQR